MSVSNISDALMENVLLTRKWKMHFNSEVLSATKTLVVDDPPVQLLDPNAATQKVLLPAEADSEGLMFLIGSLGDGTQDLLVKEDSDTTLIATITTASMGILFCDGTTWFAFAATATT